MVDTSPSRLRDIGKSSAWLSASARARGELYSSFTVLVGHQDLSDLDLISRSHQHTSHIKHHDGTPTNGLCKDVRVAAVYVTLSDCLEPQEVKDVRLPVKAAC